MDNAMTDVSPAARADLTPTGKLRVGINLGNFLLTAKDPATGEPRGIAVDLGRELGRRLGAPVEIIGYPTPGELADAAAKPRMRATATTISMFAAPEVRSEASSMRLVRPVPRISTPLMSP